MSIDGWGCPAADGEAKKDGAADAKQSAGDVPPWPADAIAAATTPVMDRLCGKASDALPQCHVLSATVDASGLAVGLPEGVMGNSEVGHLTMGAGQAQFQDLVRINLSIKDGSFAKNGALLAALEHAKTSSSSRVHFLGLVSDAGVHAHIEHLKAYLKAAKAAGVENAYVHFFSDGRDTPPTSGASYVTQLNEFMAQNKYGRIASLMGRYYAMDRDKRWERTQRAYEALVAGVDCTPASLDGEGGAPKVESLMAQRYAADMTDEFMLPIRVGGSDGLITDHDTLIFIDFRADRMRQIVQSFAAEEGATLPFTTRVTQPKALYVAQTTLYSGEFAHLPVIFPPQIMRNTLAEWLSSHRLSQFHCAETEKYAHVTFFFNGGVEKVYDGEDRKLVSSPSVATYDLAPAMSVKEVGTEVVRAIDQNRYAFVMCNLAPPDMVGHTGKYHETVTACEATDVVIGKIADACVRNDYVLVVTSDHGNAEEMVDRVTGKPRTSHTTNFVPLCIANAGDQFELGRAEGTLADIAPSVLQLMELPIPSEMTGSSMLKVVPSSNVNSGAAVVTPVEAALYSIDGKASKVTHELPTSAAESAKSPRKKARRDTEEAVDAKPAKRKDETSTSQESSAAKKKREDHDTHFFHITSWEAWERVHAAGVKELRADSLDGAEGFIHCSTEAQLEGTLNRFFAGATGPLAIVHINGDKLTSALKWEVGVVGLPPFPHVYGPINMSAITSTTKLNAKLKYTSADVPTIVKE